MAKLGKKTENIRETISTGRKDPLNLVEQIAMEAVQSNPMSGKVILNKLNDPRFNNCVKMQQVFDDTSIGKITIHYVADIPNQKFYDFKFTTKPKVIENDRFMQIY